MNEIQKMRIEVRLEDALAEVAKYEALSLDAFEKGNYERAERINSICSAKRGEYSGMMSVLNVLGYGTDSEVVNGVEKVKVVKRQGTILM